MKLSDYVADVLAKEGLAHVFGVTGGAVVHLFDSIDKHPSLKPIFNHHEQASAFAAEAYGRATNHLGCAIVTTGPGGTNALTGLCAAWLDSIPCIFISGQVRFAHADKGKAVRQLGPQHFSIVPVVSHMTKYAVMVDDAKKIKYYLQKAVYIAKNGRPGPVWIDLPLDFQWASINPDELENFNPSELNEKKSSLPDNADIQKCLDALRQAKRPLVLVGQGVRLAHAESEIKTLLQKLRVPFLASWNMSDLFNSDDTLNIGRPGMFGQRGANLAVQNCDLLLALGSHLCIPLTGSMTQAFARDAKVIAVNIDQEELNSCCAHVDIPIECDVKDFLKNILSNVKNLNPLSVESWRKKCLQYKKYNLISKTKNKKYVDPYVFMDVLSDALNKNDAIVVDGGGTINQIAFQSLRTKEGQRLMISGGLCAMGSGLPESIGACLALNKRRTICLCGDGSMQLNIQELQTILHYKLPIKIFVFNNGGYLSIRHTQYGFLKKNYVGSSPKGNLSLPDFVKVAEAYGFETLRVNSQKNLSQILQKILKKKGPALCEIMVSENQEVSPRQGFDEMTDGTFKPRPLEDMYPFLNRKEFAENMITAPWTTR